MLAKDCRRQRNQKPDVSARVGEQAADGVTDKIGPVRFLAAGGQKLPPGNGELWSRCRRLTWGYHFLRCAGVF